MSDHETPFAYRRRNRGGALKCWLCPAHRWTPEGFFRHLRKQHGREIVR